jgi:hypothetical protein
LYPTQPSHDSISPQQRRLCYSAKKDQKEPQLGLGICIHASFQFPRGEIDSHHLMQAQNRSLPCDALIPLERMEFVEEFVFYLLTSSFGALVCENSD